MSTSIFDSVQCSNCGSPTTRICILPCKECKIRTLCVNCTVACKGCIEDYSVRLEKLELCSSCANQDKMRCEECNFIRFIKKKSVSMNKKEEI